MNCLIGIEKKLEDNMMFYREPVKINKEWSDMIRFFLVIPYIFSTTRGLL